MVFQARSIADNQKRVARVIIEYENGKVARTSLLKTLWEKEKLLVRSNFSFSQSVFYLFEEESSIFVKFEIVVCELFKFGRV